MSPPNRYFLEWPPLEPHPIRHQSETITVNFGPSLKDPDLNLAATQGLRRFGGCIPALPRAPPERGALPGGVNRCDGSAAFDGRPLGLAPAGFPAPGFPDAPGLPAPPGLPKPPGLPEPRGVKVSTEKLGVSHSYPGIP